MRFGTIAIAIALLLVGGPAPSAHAVDGEVTYTGTNTTLSGDDVYRGPFNLGFPFTFYGTEYSQVYVNLNGGLSFGAGDASYSNCALAICGASNAIYAFHDDLNTNGGQIIYYATIGAEPERKFVTQWTNIYFHGTSIQMGTFQVVLYEGTNEIQLQYRDLLGGDRALGNSATIGLKKNGSTYEQYSANTASLTQEQAIRYTPAGADDYAVDTDADYELVYLAPAGAPTSPTLVNPTNGTTGVTLRPTFEWLPVESATSYTVLVSTASNFSSTVVNQSGITGTSYTLGSDLVADTNYYWRVQSVNSNGSSLSPTRSFTTGSSNAAPETPADIVSDTFIGGSMVSSIEGGTLTANLSDPDDAEQVRYRIQIATDGSFSDLVIDYRSAFGDEGPVTYTFGQAGGTYLVGDEDTVLAADDYYLRIRAEDDAAASSAWHTASGVAFSIFEDEDPPGISAVSVDPETASAIIHWETDEAASSWVEYGPSSSYTASTTEADLSPRVTEHEVEISGLRSCVTYHFRVMSTDENGNDATGNDLTFTTKGCTAEAAVSEQTAAAVDAGTGATVDLLDEGKGISLTVPTAFASTSAHFQIKKIDEERVLASTTPPSGYEPVGTYTYALHAVTDSFAVIEEFDAPIMITLSYAQEDVAGMDERSLRIYRWNGAEWVPLANCSVDTSAHTVTCATDHFSTFSLFGQAAVSDSEEDAPPRKGNTSIRARVNNLLKLGKDQEAASLMRDWPQLFGAPSAEAAEQAAPEPVPAQVPAEVATTTVAVRDLTLAMEGEDVRLLQALLISVDAGPAARELARVGATGYFGTYTRNALGEYQAARGVVPAAGYFGPITRAQMKGVGLPQLWW